MPSHQTSPSSVNATLVKMTSRLSDLMQLGLVLSLVPGATPKYPDSGLIATRRPSFPGLIQAMSSPIVVTFQPANELGGTIIAKFVLPQALGNAAATWYFLPVGDVTPRISMCSASQPSSRPMVEAMRSAKHF